ncbi:MAG TPA: hypothetical protein P5275_20655 [Saprospiraceae bacterium]|nr:hypothetical protein [Saprospiraceae bacterium]MCB9272254.1 hypothetical protein [Lewinellaceae bacterium]HPG07362.1 hypothetical protein [Saprospiraceae bacterium]HPQ97991.1 hypothetical protein [Saprospiraceae bacterium]HQU54050.1 hypothetical protein [Saprospiraceae bacterium]
MEEEKNYKNLAIILGALLAIAILVIGWLAWSGANKNKMISTQDQELDSLLTVRDGLIFDLDSMKTAYATAAIENDSLKGSLENAKELLTSKDQQIYRLTRKANNDAKSLRAEIANLQTAKSDLDAQITMLKTQNDSLRNQNEELQAQVAAYEIQTTELKGQVGDLEQANALMKQRASQLANQAFKASSMAVNYVKNNDKNTLKSKKVRKINVAFDLVDVPEEYLGPQNVYLYITNADGVPVGPGSKVRVGEDARTLVIEAQDTKKVNIGPTQHLEFTYELAEKLKPGYYIASVYSDKGLLGSSIFQLN